MVDKKTQHLFFGNWSIRKKLALALCCISILMVAYSSLGSYKLTTNKIMDMSIKLSENNTKIAGEILSHYLKSVNNVTLQIALLPSLRNLAEKKEPSPQETSSATSNISYGVRNALNIAASDGYRFGYVKIFLSNGYEYSSSQIYNNEFYDYESCLKYLASYDISLEDEYTRPHWIDTISFYDSVEDRQVPGLVYIRFIYDSVTMNKQGIIVSVLHEEQLCNTYSKYNTNAFIIGPKGKVLSSPNKTDIGKQYPDNNLSSFVLNSKKLSGSEIITKTDGKEELVTFLPTMENSAFLIAPFNFYTDLRKQEMSGYVNSVVFLTLFGILAAIGLAMLTAKGLSNSILNLAAFVKRVYNGNFEERFFPLGHDEVVYLSEKINDMLDQIQNSARMREEVLKANQQLEIRLLQSQINPHFLYNTLDSALYSIQRKNTENAAEIIIELSKFFRFSLARGKAEVSLSNELQLIRCYVDIQRLARRREISVIYKIEPDLYSYPIVKLTLQPIIENAILHGFAGYKDSDGSIVISASHTDKTLKIVVKDNGIGFLPDDLQKLNDSLRIYPPPMDLKTFGLYNVNRRLVQTYGEAYGICVESEVTVYTAVTLNMPYSNKGIMPHEKK